VPHISHMTKAIILLGCALLLCIGGCANVLPAKEDPRPVEDIIDRAEQLIRTKAYAAAAKQYAVVLIKEPKIGRYYLRHAEILERIDEDKEAYRTYERAMEMVAEEDPDHLQLMHRLALINANHLYKLDEAEDLLLRMPGTSIERYDVAAFLFYQASQYDESIKLLNKALERVTSPDQKALLLYHAALVYLKLEDEKNTFGSLYYAINNAEHLGLIRDIEQLWQEIN